MSRWGSEEGREHTLGEFPGHGCEVLGEEASRMWRPSVMSRRVGVRLDRNGMDKDETRRNLPLVYPPTLPATVRLLPTMMVNQDRLSVDGERQEDGGWQSIGSRPGRCGAEQGVE